MLIPVCRRPDITSYHRTHEGRDADPSAPAPWHHIIPDVRRCQTQRRHSDTWHMQTGWSLAVTTAVEPRPATELNGNTPSLPARNNQSLPTAPHMYHNRVHFIQTAQFMSLISKDIQSCNKGTENPIHLSTCLLFCLLSSSPCSERKPTGTSYYTGRMWHRLFYGLNVRPVSQLTVSQHWRKSSIHLPYITATITTFTSIKLPDHLQLFQLRTNSTVGKLLGLLESNSINGTWLTMPN